MYWDAFASMVVYTLVTCAFFLLGAAVLHGRGEIPEGPAMIRSLSKIYTESAGAGAMVIYLVGAIVVLFSTLFAGSAAWTRMFSDAFAHLGLLDYSNLRQRRKWILGFAWFFPLAWTVLGLTFKAPIAHGYGRRCRECCTPDARGLRGVYLPLSSPSSRTAPRSDVRCSAVAELRLHRRRWHPRWPSCFNRIRRRALTALFAGLPTPPKPRP